MIKRTNAEAYCSEDIAKIENYAQAINDKTQMWHCHHRLEIDENKTRAMLIVEKLYWNRPASELIFLTKADHTKLHKLGERNPWFGKHLPTEIKKKMSISHSGEKNPAFGRKWFTNGIDNVYKYECPGEGWVRGRKKNI